jgi:hypothetical protein
MTLVVVVQVTNQLVKICKHHIGDDLTELWSKLFEEIQSGNVIDDIKENFHLDKKVRKNISIESFIVDLYSTNRMSNDSEKCRKVLFRWKAMC